MIRSLKRNCHRDKDFGIVVPLNIKLLFVIKYLYQETQLDDSSGWIDVKHTYNISVKNQYG